MEKVKKVEKKVNMEKVESLVSKLENLGENERKRIPNVHPIYVAKVVNPRNKKPVVRVEIKPDDTFKPIAVIRSLTDLELIEATITEIKNSLYELVLAVEKTNERLGSSKKSTKAVDFFTF